jgi:hypothetical protein
MFDSQIKSIIDKLLKNNTIFGENGFFYKNSIELAQNGISDHYINMFYIRPLQKGGNKYQVKEYDVLNTITGNFRLLIQLSKNYKNPIEAIMSQLDVRFLGWNDDTSQIFKAETGKEYESYLFCLYSIDFELIKETSKFSCNPKCIKTC